MSQQGCGLDPGLRYVCWHPSFLYHIRKTVNKLSRISPVTEPSSNNRAWWSGAIKTHAPPCHQMLLWSVGACVNSFHLAVNLECAYFPVNVYYLINWWKNTGRHQGKQWKGLKIKQHISAQTVPSSTGVEPAAVWICLKWISVCELPIYVFFFERILKNNSWGGPKNVWGLWPVTVVLLLRKDCVV